jgi:hypothetical protein
VGEPGPVDPPRAEPTRVEAPAGEAQAGKAPAGGAPAAEAPAGDAPAPAGPTEHLAAHQAHGASLVEHREAEEAMAEQTRALLTSVLDRLGAANHRPFSRA